MTRLTTILVLFITLTLVNVSLAKEAIPNEDPKIEERFKALTLELRCLKCQNQTIYDSKAGLADDLRRQIREQINAGKTDDEIVAYMVERYGDFIRYKPAFDVKNLMLWIGPFLFLAIGIGFLILQLRKRRAMVDEGPLSKDQLDQVEALIKKGGDKA